MKNILTILTVATLLTSCACDNGEKTTNDLFGLGTDSTSVTVDSTVVTTMTDVVTVTDTTVTDSTTTE